MTAHQGAAGVVERLRTRSRVLNGPDIGPAEYRQNDAALDNEAAILIEALSKALSEAEASASVSFKCGVAHQERANEMEARALAAESRLAEAMKVIEPFALIAEHDIGSDETDADTYQPITYNTVPRISVGHLRAARRFLNAGKE